MTGSALSERITQHLAQLSPKERQLAEFLLTYESELAIYSSADMARLAQVSKPVVSRFFKRLGYDGFYQVREDLRRNRASGSPQLEQLCEHNLDEQLNAHQQQESRNWQQTLVGLQGQPLEDITSSIMRAKRVLLIGLRNSYPIALHWREQLLQLRSNVWLLPHSGQTLSEELVGLEEQDLVIVVALRRRPKLVKPLVQYLAKTPASLLLITDPSGVELATHANWTLPCYQLSPGGFASYASAMAMVSLLCNLCQTQEQQPRIQLIDQLYDNFDELEPPLGT
ncbi:MurR/RpiR family transcriptional regulator [Celerinatantimonas sp. YJH-8]|uniref:MurR/RpiR family transcriptional regulator n=1 Tax=Celerinatantimonas sp. YJH-8 TaxID=3228714 RepID=UPI0038C99354